MTGTGFDGLVVNHGGLNEVTDHLYKMVKDIDDRMNNLEKDLAPLQSEWSGNAQQAYHTAKTKWDTAIAEMMQLMNDMGNTVGTSNQEYHAADMRGANSFQIG
jgi:6 kDa early secretory antigenic target